MLFIPSQRQDSLSGLAGSSAPGLRSCGNDAATSAFVPGKQDQCFRSRIRAGSERLLEAGRCLGVLNYGVFHGCSKQHGDRAKKRSIPTSKVHWRILIVPLYVLAPPQVMYNTRPMPDVYVQIMPRHIPASITLESCKAQKPMNITDRMLAAPTATGHENLPLAGPGPSHAVSPRYPNNIRKSPERITRKDKSQKGYNQNLTTHHHVTSAFRRTPTIGIYNRNQ